MHDRDSDITKFSYPSYRKLKKTLGEFDAVVECNEIAIKEFIEHASRYKINEYIQQLSKKHKLKVDEVNFLKFSTRIRQYYIASVFQQSEQFLKDFKIEYKKYFPEKKWLEPNDGETKLQNTLNNISLTITKDILDIYEYYRLVRNYMSHTDRDSGELKKIHTSICSNNNEFINNVNLNIPNLLEKINFSDFLIITNVVKHIAFVISSHAKPENQIIAEILFLQAKDNPKTYQGIKKHINDNDRIDLAIKSYIKTTFGRFSNSDIDNITLEFKKRLLA